MQTVLELQALFRLGESLKSTSMIGRASIHLTSLPGADNLTLGAGFSSVPCKTRVKSRSVAATSRTYMKM